MQVLPPSFSWAVSTATVLVVLRIDQPLQRVAHGSEISEADNMKVLITGGAGFIGSHLVDACIQRGDQVSVIDDLSTGSRQNLTHLEGHPNFAFTLDDVRNQTVVGALVDDCDVVFHLAAAVGVRLVVENPVKTIETNVQGTEVLLAEAAKTGKVVLLTSTSEVYGLSADVPFQEEGNLVLGNSKKGRWSYACSKLLDEFLALAYHREQDLPAIVVRLFNTVGPRQTGRYGMVIPRFVQQALRNEPITVYGDGSQSRCFGFVEDVVSAMIGLIEKPAARGDIFNIGSSEEVSIQELAEQVREMTGSDSEIVHVPYDQAYAEGFEDMPRRTPDLAKISRLTGYQPEATLADILSSVIAYYRAASRVD